MKARVVFLLCVAIFASTAVEAQQDPASDSTFDPRWLADSDHGGITITSGKTYNRVEGLPVLLGPTYKGRVGPGNLTISALGILRTANGFHWDSENIGHKLTVEMRIGRRRGYMIGASSFDVVEKIEPWQLSEPDASLSAFFLRRDYFDYFARHGGRVYGSLFRSDLVSVSGGYSHERWSSRRARDVFTVLRGDEDWRPNPGVDDGTVHVADLSADLDSRNTPDDPSAGWLINARYEYGVGDFTPRSSVLGSPPSHVAYGRAFLDLRKYNRISPKRQLNTRLVVGGWVHGDPLPFQRRFSVGGIGTLPGFDFRMLGIGTDVGQCSTEGNQLAGRPAQCERVALVQAEYRHELVSELFDIFNRNRIKVRGAVFRVKPAVVLFADAGRGWLVGKREGDLKYPAWSLPGFDTYRTDVGIGLDMGIAGVYIAKAVSEAKEPANVFIRIRNKI